MNVFFQDKVGGTFIDIGAHEGIIFSNTYFFEKNLGWKGICFEPNPVTYQKLVWNRNCICLKAGVSDVEGVMQFVSHPCTWVSGFLDKYSEEHAEKWKVGEALANHSAKLIDVNCYRLNTILEKYDLDTIDLLSIDTEGGELEILKSIDYEKFLIRVIIVENIYRDPEYRSFLEDKGYTYATRLHRDEVYFRLDL